MTTTGNFIVKTTISGGSQWQEFNGNAFLTALKDHTFTRDLGCIKLYDERYEANPEDKDVQLHGVIVNDDPQLVCNRHLAVEKDIIAKGMFDSLEGEITLNAGATYAPGWSTWSTPYNHAKTTGGISSTQNPFIWLAQGGIYGSYGTLEIRVTAINDNWDWGNLTLGNLSAHGSVIIYGSSTGGTLGNQYGYLSSTGSGFINGYTGNVPVSLTTFSRIICGAEIDVYSDERDKNLVENLSAQTALSAVMRLNPIHFAWNQKLKRVTVLSQDSLPKKSQKLYLKP